MSALLPVQAAAELRDGIGEYLGTTFALADERARTALADFVSDPEHGMFHGPYVRTRMPFQPDAGEDPAPLDWLPGWFTPYIHQAQAFSRLTSRPGPEGTLPWRRPEPTLVVTGTGSGKTESFLYPVLDHARRTRAFGVTGVKALLLYPMNALAIDQAERLTRLLADEPALAGVTAGIYTGEHSGSGRTTVDERGLITDRATIRETPPDLLLTNYKMLDQLLLRPEDAGIWEQSAHSLQYVVLDEFHTYDGAQGADVALLLRRLGLTVATHLDGADGPVPRTEEDAARPLGRITPVATSATLGDDGDTSAVRHFAETVFGEPFPPDSVLTETRRTVDDWMGTPAHERLSLTDSAGPAVVDAVNAAVAENLDLGLDPAEAVYQGVCREFLGETAYEQTGLLLESLRRHQLVAEILTHSTQAIGLDELTTAVFGALPANRRTATRTFLEHVLGAYSHLRALVTTEDGLSGRALPSVEAHLWVRELSRIDRAVSTGVRYHWHDDGPETALDPTESDDLDHLPAIFCRHCGRAGWMTAYEPGTETPSFTPDTIRRQSMGDRSAVRALISGEQELRAAEEHHTPLSEIRGGRDATTALMWLDPTRSSLALAETHDPEQDLDPRIVPVLLHVGRTAAEQSERQTCPACGTRDSIRYVGSAVATLLSVALSNLFGTRGLDSTDKRTLVFTDSVQDASHRAGFVQARAHAFAQRTAVTAALAGGELPLDELARRVRDQAETPVQRYHLLHPSIADRPNFTAFWDATAPQAQRSAASRRAGDRLLFDLALEFGLRSAVGRTLSLTGTAVSTVDAAPETLRDSARTAWSSVAVESRLTDAEPDDAALEAWARVVLERVLHRGGVTHPWLTTFLRTDGNTFHLTRRDARARGVPGFPPGGWPSFPRVGPTLTSDRYHDGTDAVATSRSWYARWTARHLHVTPDSGHRLVVALLAELARADVLHAETSETSATVYGIPPARVLVRTEDAPGELRCDVCHNATPAARPVRELVTGAPCLTVDCSGTLRVAPIGDNYYRRMYTASDLRSVVAREHTSLLEPEDRAAIERQFKTGAEEPGAPNVLVATPTLEMGIDIGDLSSVVLSSLPSTVAAYVQRVGRAGRLTGNSLVVALVRGRGKTLSVVHDPLSLINGTVQTPAAFLSAAEILRRQFLAHSVDALVLEGVHPQSRTALYAMSTHSSSFVSVLTEEIPPRVETLLERFLGSLEGHVSPDAAADLRAWATGVRDDGSPAPHQLTSTLLAASQRWRDEYEELTHRLDRLDEVLGGLREKAASPGATEEDHATLRAAESSRKSTARRLTTLREEYWIAAMERHGLLPGYQLLDDTVDLHTSVTTLDPETSEWSLTTQTYTRSISSALTELAPGNSFYADRMRIDISAVDMGSGGDDVVRWRFCPVCSHAADELPGTTPGACPSCGAAGWADAAQVVDVVPLRQVSAQVTRDAATVDERDDERRQRRYTTARTLSWTPEDSRAPWFVDANGFGVRYLRRADLRWLNLGTGPGSTLTLGGAQPAAPLFRLCEYCGHLDSQAGGNSRRDHRPWCVHTTAAEEHNTHLALGRRLDTEGVLLYLPSTVSAYDPMVVPSLVAAIKLGFRRVLGGDPDHLDVASVVVPQVDTTAPALLLHDRIPGGTGYLAGFTTPQQVWELLHTAWQTVRACACADEGRHACPRCLLPHTPPSDVDRVSRSVAESALHLLLRGTRADSDPEGEPAFEDWSVTETQTVDLEGDSVLEVRFRHVFATALENAGCTVTTQPSGKYTKLQITAPGSRVTWDLRPQVDVHEAGTRPDYQLVADDPNLPRFAVYTDGYAFHASPAHNRVADDARKREAVRALGWIPWSVTAADLDEAEASLATGAQPPAWERPAVARNLANRLGIPSQRLDAAGADPIRLLVGIVLDPAPDTWRAVGHASAVLAMTDGVGTGAERVLERPHARLTVRSRSSTLVSVQAELVIDRSAEAVAADDYRADWQWWLRWSNRLALKEDSTVIAAVDGLQNAGDEIDAELRSLSDSPKSVVDRSWPEEPVSLSPAWHELDQEIDDEEETAAREHQLVRTLAQAGVPVPDYGEEVDGVLVSFSWPGARVALTVSDPSDTVQPTESNGWAVVTVPASGSVPTHTIDQLRASLSGATDDKE